MNETLAALIPSAPQEDSQLNLRRTAFLTINWTPQLVSIEYKEELLQDLNPERKSSSTAMKRSGEFLPEFCPVECISKVSWTTERFGDRSRSRATVLTPPQKKSEYSFISEHGKEVRRSLRQNAGTQLVGKPNLPWSAWRHLFALDEASGECWTSTFLDSRIVAEPTNKGSSSFIE